MGPQFMKNVQKLQRVQERFTKKNRDLTYEKRSRRLISFNLAMRR